MTTTVSSRSLIDHGVHVIREGQAASGAYVASPNFSQYRFAWLRDGAYCALAMDAVGEIASAEAFHAWVARVVEGQRSRIRSVVARVRDGQSPRNDEMLPTRYTLDGEVERVIGEGWPNFQLDGYGTWLFALHSHLSEGLPESLFPAVELTADYLEATWRLPCFDYWEEYGDRQHTSTLAAIAAGLRAASRMLERPEAEEVAHDIVAYIREHCVFNGALGKGPVDARVDASLLSLATPFGILDADDPVMRATTERIRVELASASGGIRRYLGDTYFGGNPWLLLTAWLGWHDRLNGNESGVVAARNWVIDHATKWGDLPEQILHEPQNAAFVGSWLERWGPVASPLLWSHAKFILMESNARAATWS